MKKLVLVLAFYLPLLAQAQEAKESDSTTDKRLIKEFTLGIMVTSTAAHAFGDKTPFLLSWTFAPCISLVTEHTQDNIMLDVGNNSIQTLNGYLLPKDWDVYCFLTKSLSLKDAYGSIGIEKALFVAKRVEFVFYGELGTDFRGTNSVAIGLLMHPYLSLLKDEKKH